MTDKWLGTPPFLLIPRLKSLLADLEQLAEPGSYAEHAPCLLFLDEIDSIGDRSKFPSRHADYSTQVVNGLLECLDGIGGREGVVVVGACNHPDKIDPAVIRSGRLEKHIHFPLPDAAARAEILAFHLPTLAEDPAIKEIGARLPGNSGADLERLAREARRVARREGRSVTIDDIRSKIAPPPVLTFDHLLQIASGLETSLVQFAVKLAEMKTLEGNDLEKRLNSFRGRWRISMQFSDLTNDDQVKTV